jgi:hypothetical protein
MGGSPFFPKEGGGLWPPFVHFTPLLRKKRSSTIIKNIISSQIIIDDDQEGDTAKN